MASDIFPELQALFGKHIDSAEVVAFLAKYPKHKVSKPSDGHQHVVSEDHGFDVVFGPPDGQYRGGRTKEKRVLISLFLFTNASKYKSFLNPPLGLSLDDAAEQLIVKLGSPIQSEIRETGGFEWLKWKVDSLVLHVEFKKDQPKTKMFLFMTEAVVAALE